MSNVWGSGGLFEQALEAKIANQTKMADSASAMQTAQAGLYGAQAQALQDPVAKVTQMFNKGFSQAFSQGGVPHKGLRACADGGIPAETPAQLRARMAAKYGLGGGAAEPAPAPAPAPVQVAQAPAQPQGFGDRLRTLATGNLEGRMKAAGFKNGGRPGVDDEGYIHGPKGVDKVPAKVAETGEDILVSRGERIVNEEQNEALEKLAAQAGMGLDEYLVASTGKPVGPKMKEGLRAAETGWSVANKPNPYSNAVANIGPGPISLGAGQKPTIYDNGGLPADVVQRGIDTMKGQLATPAAPTPAAPTPAAPTAPTPTAGPWWQGKATAASTDMTLAGTPQHTAAVNSELAAAGKVDTPVAVVQPAPAPAAQPKRLGFADLPQSDPSYDRKEMAAARGGLSVQQEANPNIKWLREAGVTGAIQGDVTEKGKTPATGIRTIETGNGKVFAGRDAKGQLNVASGMEKGSLSDIDAARDKEFAAKGYGKDAYGNWMTPQRLADKQALKDIQLSNARFNAFDPSITDRNVKADGLRQVLMSHMEGEAGRKAQGDAAKNQMELARLGLEKRRVDLTEQGQTQSQKNSDREFNQKNLDSNLKDINSWMDTIAPTAGLKDAELTKAQQKRAVLQQVMMNHWGGNVPSDRAKFLEAQPRMARDAAATMKLYDALKDGAGESWLGPFGPNNGANPALTLQALTPKGYDEKTDTLTLRDGYKVPGSKIWGQDADMREALLGRVAK